MHTEPIPRPWALRFSMDTDPGLMRACVEAWNRRFANHFEGVGYFPDEPEIETYPGGSCLSFYLRANSRLWSQILRSRTLTPDEPVLACQMAYGDGSGDNDQGRSQQ